jgi:hypothetical protein
MKTFDVYQAMRGTVQWVGEVKAASIQAAIKVALSRFESTNITPLFVFAA